MQVSDQLLHLLQAPLHIHLKNDSVDSLDPGLRQRRQVKRKRESHSSASEMLGFLTEYGIKRENVEEEKLNLMKTMHATTEKRIFSSVAKSVKETCFSLIVRLTLTVITL